MSDANAAASELAGDPFTLGLRMFAWMILAVMCGYLFNNVLIEWFGAESPSVVLSGGESSALGYLVFVVYLVALITPVALVTRWSGRTLRQDSQRITEINAYLIRAAFWAVLLVGVGDTIISFMRVEDMLPPIFGDTIASDLGRSQFRGMWVHTPLLILGMIVAAFTRTLGFTWLALLVVVAELLIVIGRFIFSYEQAFMADLVRFWYAALFLFASAYTLIEEGHVRVDVLYAGFSSKTRGYVNAFGSLALGVVLCWAILVVGMGGKASIINSPLLSFETTQTGFGMYVKYLMAGFLAVFAVSMMNQFVAYLLESVADIRGEPGKREIAAEIAH